MSLYNASQARRSLIDTLKFRAISQIATVLGYAILVRGMPKSDFGVFNLLYSFIPVLGTIASFGLEQILRRYQPEYLRQGNVAGAVALVRFVASARFAANVVFIGVLLLTWNYFAPTFHLGPYRIPFAYIAILLILHFQAQILILSLASHMLHRFSVGSTTALSIGKLIGYGVMLYFGSFTLNHAIFADTAAYALVYLFLRQIYRRRCVPKDLPVRYQLPSDERKRMFRYGLFNNFNDAGTLLLGGAADNFFIAAFIDPISVGIYAFYGRLNEMAINVLPVRLFDNIIQPLFFSVKPADADQRLRQFFTFLLDINFILLWPMLAFAVVYHAEIVQVIFGGKFVEYSWLLPLIVFFSTVNSISVPVTLAAQYEEKAGIILLSKIFVAYNIVAMIVLLPVAGIYGAILARGSAEAFKNLFIWWWVRHRAEWMNVRAVLVIAPLLWGAVAATCYAVKRELPGSPILQLVFGALMCGVGLLIYVRTPAIAAADRVILASVFHGKEARVLQRLGLMKPTNAKAPGA
jgi:O-antigen/teichoic acid export membrane protein